MFSESERRIYGPYADGKSEKPVYADPIEVHELLVHHMGGDPDMLLKKVRFGAPITFDENGKSILKPLPWTEEETANAARAEPVRFEAKEKIVKATIAAFDLKPFDKADGKGCTRDYIIGLFNHFVAWMSDQKKTLDGMPMSTAASASVAIRSAMRPSLASGSTSGGCGCNEVTTSVLASRQPMNAKNST